MLCPFRYSFPVPIGCLEIITDGQSITGIVCVSSPHLPADAPETALHREAAAQLQAYFAGRLRQFDLPLSPRGTSFQHRVWAALCQIPYGQTRSYRQLAVQLGLPGGARAVGQANARNPIPFCIPCHRVVAAGGGLGGYSLGSERKRFLLALEQGRCTAGSV